MRRLELAACRREISSLAVSCEDVVGVNLTGASCDVIRRLDRAIDLANRRPGLTLMEDKSASLQAPPADAAAAAAVCPYRLAAFLSLLGFVLLFAVWAYRCDSSASADRLIVAVRPTCRTTLYIYPSLFPLHRPLPDLTLSLTWPKILTRCLAPPINQNPVGPTGGDPEKGNQDNQNLSV